MMPPILQIHDNSFPTIATFDPSNSTMRTAILTLLTLATAAFAEIAPSDLAKRLQQGLVEEDINRDPAAAIEQYSILLEEFEAGRQFAATALFRSAECQRKLGDDEKAAEHLKNLLTLFPEQSELNVLARQNLAALGVEVPRATVGDLELTDSELNELKKLRTIARDSPDIITSPDAEHLIEAVADGHAEAARFLLENGADPDQRGGVNFRGRTSRFTGVMGSLEFAAAQGNLRIVKLLLDAGATLDPAALTAAVKEQRNTITETLFDRIEKSGAKFDFSGVLTNAAKYGRPDDFQKIVDHGADPKELDDQGMSQLHHAASHSDATFCRFLVKMGLPVDARSIDGRTALDIASGNRNAEIIKYLLGAGADPNNQSSDKNHRADAVTPLMRALGVGYTRRKETVDPALKLLFDAGADVNHQDSNGNTPLHYAVAHAFWIENSVGGIFKGGSNSKYNPQWSGAIKPLLDAGADIDTANNRKKLAIDYASAGTQIHQILAHHSRLHGKDRVKTILYTGSTGIVVAVQRTDENEAPPSLAEFLRRRTSPVGSLVINSLGKPAPKPVDLVKMSKTVGAKLPPLAWGDHLELGSGAGIENAAAIRALIVPDLKRKVTVKRGDREASFIVVPTIRSFESEGGLYDPYSGIVHDADTPYDLVTKAFLITPRSSRSVATLTRANGEVISVRLMEGARTVVPLADGDHLEIMENDRPLGNRVAITNNDRLLYWESPVTETGSLTDLIASAYGGMTPFVISHPDFSKLALTRAADADSLTDDGLDVAALIAKEGSLSLGDKGAILDIPTLPEDLAREPWSGLKPEEIAWLEKKLARNISIQALDQPRRELKIGPEMFSYKQGAEGWFREPVGKDDKRFDVRGLELSRMVINAGYSNGNIYRFHSAGPTDIAGNILAVDRNAWIQPDWIVGIPGP